MICETISLREEYPLLAGKNMTPALTVYAVTPPQEAIDINRPAVLICPGGGYGFVSPREAEPVALHYVKAGFNCFVLDYTVHPNGRYPQQILEAACGVDLIRKHQEKWNLNGKIAVVGFSAGGHLAASYSVLWNHADIQEKFNAQPVDAAVLSYPVLSAGDYAHSGSIYNLLGHEPSGAEKEKFSLQNRVTKDTVPTFLWHTAADAAVPVENTLLYAMALRKQQVPFEVHIYPEGAHGLSTADELSCNGVTEDHRYAQNWIDHSICFLRKYML